MTRTAQQLKETAYHEAGHAAVANFFRLPFHHVTIIPGEGSFGHILHKALPESFDPYDKHSVKIRYWIEKRCICCWSGMVAQRKMRSRSRYDHSGAISDRETAIQFAGLLYDGKTLEKYLGFVEARTEDLVYGKLWQDVEAIAKALLDRQTLKRREVTEVVNSAYVVPAEILKGIKVTPLP